MIPDVKPTVGTWQNLYTLSGFAVGTRLLVQNKSAGGVLLWEGAPRRRKLMATTATATRVTGYVPAGYYARLRTVNNTGTPGFAYRAGQEVLQ